MSSRGVMWPGKLLMPMTAASSFQWPLLPYGTAYGKTDGMTNNDFRVYSSPDLEHWTFEGTLLKDRPYALYYLRRGVQSEHPQVCALV